MPALVWPSNIPSRLERSGASLPYADARRRFETSDGAGRVRKRMSAAVRPISGALNLSAAEHAYLRKFWDETTKGGVLPFWFPDVERRDMLLLDDRSQTPLLTASGAPLLISAWMLCQFGAEPPSPQPLAGGRMRVMISLLVLP